MPGTTYQVHHRRGNFFSVRVSLAGIEPVGFRIKSDLRNHQAIVQPRLYDSLMVTQITLKTESPHGLLSGRRTEVDPLYPGLIILAVYDCGHAFQSHLRDEPCANARLHEKPVLATEA